MNTASEWITASDWEHIVYSDEWQYMSMLTDELIKITQQHQRRNKLNLKPECCYKEQQFRMTFHHQQDIRIIVSFIVVSLLYNKQENEWYIDHVLLNTRVRGVDKLGRWLFHLGVYHWSHAHPFDFSSILTSKAGESLSTILHFVCVHNYVLEQSGLLCYESMLSAMASFFLFRTFFSVYKIFIWLLLATPFPCSRLRCHSQVIWGKSL